MHVCLTNSTTGDQTVYTRLQLKATHALCWSMLSCVSGRARTSGGMQSVRPGRHRDRGRWSNGSGAHQGGPQAGPCPPCVQRASLGWCPHSWQHLRCSHLDSCLGPQECVMRLCPQDCTHGKPFELPWKAACHTQTDLVCHTWYKISAGVLGHSWAAHSLCCIQA